MKAKLILAVLVSGLSLGAASSLDAQSSAWGSPAHNGSTLQGHPLTGQFFRQGYESQTYLEAKPTIEKFRWVAANRIQDSELRQKVMAIGEAYHNLAIQGSEVSRTATHALNSVTIGLERSNNPDRTAREIVASHGSILAGSVTLDAGHANGSNINLKTMNVAGANQ